MNPFLLERPTTAESAPGPAARGFDPAQQGFDPAQQGFDPAQQGFARSSRPQADFTPVRAVMSGPAGKAGKSAAEACLEDSFRPSLEDSLSFLVNGFWLIGRHRILEWEARDGRVAEGLRAQGHDVTAVERIPEGGAEAVPAGAADRPAGGFDRAMFLSRALGYAGGGEPAAWLKAMHRALRPGGLVLFHVLDRDRVWDLVRDFTSREGAAGISFDPRTGEVTVRIRSESHAGEGRREGAAAGTRQAVRAFNLGEVKALLAEAGFVLERAYGGWNGGSLEDEGGITGRILVVASKPRRKARVRRAIFGSDDFGAEVFGSEERGLPRKRGRKGLGEGGDG